MRRVGWEPSEVAKKIAQENVPEKTGYVADVGGGHGREALWFAEQEFPLFKIREKEEEEQEAKRVPDKCCAPILADAL